MVSNTWVQTPGFKLLGSNTWVQTPVSITCFQTPGFMVKAPQNKPPKSTSQQTRILIEQRKK
jgi:hypothetical protein